MWQTGVAKLVRIASNKIVVLCPHCRKEHAHSKLYLGSKEVAAGCHKGYTQARSYAIPKR